MVQQSNNCVHDMKYIPLVSNGPNLIQISSLFPNNTFSFLNSVTPPPPVDQLTPFLFGRKEVYCIINKEFKIMLFICVTVNNTYVAKDNNTLYNNSSTKSEKRSMI